VRQHAMRDAVVHRAVGSIDVPSFGDRVQLVVV
jgi:hypothetical protein